MITTLMKQKRGFHRFSKLSDVGDPWAPNNLFETRIKRKTPVEPLWTKSFYTLKNTNMLKRNITGLREVKY